MVFAVISFFLGILSLNLFQELPSLRTISFGIVVLFLIAILFYCVKVVMHGAIFSPYTSSFVKQRDVKTTVNLPLMLGFFILGFLWMWLHAEHVVQRWIPTAIEGKTIEVIGVIDSIPDLQEEIVYFDFDVQRTVPSSIWPFPGKIRVHWHLPPELQVGEEWQLSIRIKKPHSYSNPGSFDVERHFFQKALVAEGTVIETLLCKKIRDPSYGHIVDRFRIWLKNKIDFSLKDHVFSGVISALVVGMQKGISFQQWEILRKTGTAHLVAVSGLHVGLVTGFVFFIIQILSKFLPLIFFRIPIPIICAMGALIVAILYALLAGFSIATQRALVMIVFLMFSLFKKRVYSSAKGYFCALMVVLILDPLSTLNMGFWLSFGAVAIILYGMKGRLNPTGLWWKWGRVQWLVGFGLTPLTLALFNTASLVSPLANLVAIPWVSLLVVPFSLIASICVIFNDDLGTFFFRLAHYALMVLWPILEKLSHILKNIFESGSFSLFNLVIVMVGFLFLSAPQGFPIKTVGLIWLLPLFLIKPSGVEKNAAKVTVLDVGQGLSAVVETQNHTLIFDTGPRVSEHIDTGERVVLPYLATRGIKEIDALIISHGDNDHAGGTHSILQKASVKKVISSEKLFSKPNIELCFAGQRWKWDGVLFEILHPSDVLAAKRNERSCVLRIQTGSQSVLFTADIEAGSEKWLMQKIPQKIASTVMLVPHHGSQTSSTIEFIRLVSPQYAIIPVGYLNRYGYPKPSVIKRYQEESIIVFDTVKDGAISFMVNDRSSFITINRHRIENKKYWHMAF